MGVTTFTKQYSSEDLCDVLRDISEEGFDHPRIELDDLNFAKGTYTVTITYTE